MLIEHVEQRCTRLRPSNVPCHDIYLGGLRVLKEHVERRALRANFFLLSPIKSKDMYYVHTPIDNGKRRSKREQTRIPIDKVRREVSSKIFECR